MKSFPANFAAEKNKKTGASPFYILECPFPSTGTIYLADYIVTTASWKGGITTKAWIKDWGQIDEDISGDMALTKVSDFSLTAIIDPNASPHLRTILETAANNIEVTDCRLYLAFRDLLGALETTDPPQIMWTGNIIDFEWVDELTMRLDMVDRSIRIDKYIGTKLDSDTYTSAHPDDIGKVMPIIYGSNNLVACLRSDWGARTTLKAAMTDSQTTVELSDASRMPASGYVVIDEEKIGYASKTGNTLNTCTRATTAVAHGPGAQTWEYKDQYDSIIAGHELKGVYDPLNPSAYPVYAEIEGERFRVDSGVEAVVSSDKHLLRATEQIKVKIEENVNLNDPGHYHNVPSSGFWYPTTGSSVKGVFTETGSLSYIIDGDPATKYGLSAIIDYAATASITANFQAYSGPTPISVYAVITHNSYVTAGFRDAGEGSVKVGSAALRIDMPIADPPTTQEVYLGTSVPTSITIDLAHPNVGGGLYEVRSHVFEIQLKICLGYTASAFTSLSKTGGIVSTRYVDRFVCLVDGYKDDGSGTITGTPSALIERPDHVVKHFLCTYVSWAVADFYTNAATEFGSVYMFSIVINDYQKIKKWLAQMAWESRCYFRFAASRAELLLRADSISSAKTITNNMIADQGGDRGDSRTTMRVRRSSLQDIINKINIHYNRDATKSGDDAYRSTTRTASDATSIARYGEKERPELFKFDFVQAQTMVEDIRDVYLARLKDRKKVVEMDLFLDNSELEFADGVTITPLSSLLCEVQKANLYPGSGQEMRNDKVHLIVKEY
jgi:hypothetical protein